MYRNWRKRRIFVQACARIRIANEIGLLIASPSNVPSIRSIAVAVELQALGHTIRLIPPSYVKAYLKRSKNDANDAAAIL